MTCHMAGRDPPDWESVLLSSYVDRPEAVVGYSARFPAVRSLLKGASAAPSVLLLTAVLHTAFGGTVASVGLDPWLGNAGRRGSRRACEPRSSIIAAMGLVWA
jgi:hypothetical protein